MKNRNIILTAILSLLGCGGLTCTAQAGPSPGNVNVVNTTTNPVPITDADNPARNAAQQELLIPIVGGGFNGHTLITIPAGKIFVLETASFSVGLPGVVAITISVIGPNITGGQGLATYQLVIPPTSPGAVGAIGSQALRLYAQPGTSVDINVDLDVAAANTTTVSVDLSGYFVNAQ